MNCDLPSLRLTEHHEGVLSGDDCAALEQHLRECPTCAELRQDLGDLVRLCRQAKGESIRMPDELRQRISSMLAMADATIAAASAPPTDSGTSPRS
jgi:predicted anti-sigma-YlaC factor YlaD